LLQLALSDTSNAAEFLRGCWQLPADLLEDLVVQNQIRRQITFSASFRRRLRSSNKPGWKGKSLKTVAGWAGCTFSPEGASVNGNIDGLGQFALPDLPDRGF